MPAPEANPLPPSNDESSDPELEELPRPRRPGRVLTLVMLALTSVASLAMAWSLAGAARYALLSGPPANIGDLTQLKPSSSEANRWVRGEALLAVEGATRYSRPLDRDSFRLAPVAGNRHLWVEIRVPSGNEGPYFVPPTSFVGRLLPASRAGLRYQGLVRRIRNGGRVPGDIWLLVDGESPAGTRWALGLFLLFAGFAMFCGYGLFQLLRPVRDS